MKQRSPVAALMASVLLVVSGNGCNSIIRTDSVVKLDGPVEAKVSATADIPPVSQAGPVKPVVVNAGESCPRVALVDVDGLLMNTPFVGPLSLGENPVSTFREKLDAVAADPANRAVVLRINSHGGGVAASGTMRADLERFKARTGLPVVACLMDQACGGAYYLASAADYIVAGPATVTGGLGVILNLYNLQDLMAQYNVIPQPVKAGKNVDIGSSTKPLSDDDKEVFQAMADEFHNKIKTDIGRSRRAMKPAEATFDGRIFTGTQARERGLVDRVGELDDALHIAAWMAIPAAARTEARYNPPVVMFRRANDPAHSPYAVSANIPLQGAGLLPNFPGLDRSKMPAFLSMWQPELTMEKLSGK